MDDLDRAGVRRLHGAAFEILRDVPFGLAPRAVGLRNLAEVVVGVFLK
jgi:hypothetical protein